MLWLLLWWLWSCTEHASPPTDIARESTSYKTENVIIVVIDGPRYQETWGDPEKRHIPYLSGELAATGINHTRFYNRGATYTNSGHTAITTGFYQWMANDGSELPRYPSILQSLLASTGAPPSKAQIITGKQKLDVLADCTSSSWRGKFNPLTDTEDREDSQTLAQAFHRLKTDQPKLALIQFRGPDYFGHAGEWDNYLKSIEETDRYVYQIWRFLQGQEYYRNKTTLLVTNDHGRHHDSIRDGFISHGDLCEGCMHINLFAAGPDFKQNYLADKPGQLVDIAPTVAELLGIELPNATGEIMWDLFELDQ